MPKPSSTKKMLTPVDQLIKKSWQEYCQRFTELIPLALLPLFGMLFCSFSLAIILVDVYTGWFKLPWALALSGGLALLLFVVGVWLNLAGPVGVYAALARKNKLALWPSFIEGGHYVGRWLMLSLAVAVMLLAWFMALVVPFFIFVIFYAMANWALFFEGYEGFSALKRSRELVKDYWFAVTGRILLMMLVAMIAGGIVNIIIFMILAIAHQAPDAYTQVSKIWSDVFGLLCLPLALIYSKNIYLDLVKIKGKSKIKKNSRHWLVALWLLVALVLFILAVVWLAQAPAITALPLGK